MEKKNLDITNMNGMTNEREFNTSYYPKTS